MSDLPSRPASAPPARALRRAVPSRRRDFAPLSGEPPAGVRHVADYLELVGGLGLVGVALSLPLALLGVGRWADSWNASVWRFAGTAIVGAAAALCWLWTARALRAGQRIAIVYGVLGLAAPLAEALWQGEGVRPSIVLTALGAVVLLSAWHRLR